MHGSVTSIVPGNESLEYLERRIGDDNYRGSRSSQHNRYTLDQIHTILALFYDHVGDGLMRIRTTDIGRRPHNLPEEIVYASFCDKAKGGAGIGTQDAMRKNLFVDLHRMGLIERHGGGREPVDPYGGSRIVYVSLTRRGLKLVNPQSSILERQLIFSRAVDTLLKGFVTVLMDILIGYPEIKKITDYEFMFFVSGVQTDPDDDFSFSTDIVRAVELLNSFRNLSLLQRRAAITYCNENLVPQNYVGDKTNKRDFHNWKNKTQQIFFLLGQTAYFDAQLDAVCLRTQRISEFDKSVKLNRSNVPKQQYLKLHGIYQKTKGFELHHVVPLSWAELPEHFKLIDDWRNLVYIDGYNHAIITQNGSRNVYMSSDNDSLVLSDRLKSNVELEYNKNVQYDLKHQKTMLRYNEELTEL